MRGYSCIGLHNPKYDVNIGGALRAAGNYNAAFVAITGHRYTRSRSDTLKYWRHSPLLTVDDLKSVIPYDCVPVAVDLLDNAIALPEYNHPIRAYYIFGAEDSTLDETITSWCKDIVYVPTTYCMNLAATVNVILYDRLYKWESE